MRYLKNWNSYILENVQPVKKADLVGVDVENFYKSLESINQDVSEQKSGQQGYKKEVETIQVGLLLLGYELPRFGVDGFFGGETARAVSKFLDDIKQENTSDQSNTQPGDEQSTEQPEQLTNKEIRQQKRQQRKEDKESKNESLFLNRIFEGTLIAPVGDRRISSGYGPRLHPVTKEPGKMHTGVDFAVPQGTPILSPADGEVITADFSSFPICGGTIIIQHDDSDLRSTFCHCNEINVKKGDQVTQNQEIGKVGGAAGTKGAGRSTGPHLHYGVKKAGNWINPLEVLGHLISDKNKPGNSGTSGSVLSDSELKMVVMPVSAIKIMITKLKEKGIKSEDLQKFTNNKINTPGNIKISLDGDWLDIAFRAIAKYESFSPTAKFDENKYRGGYGTDKIMRNGQLLDADENTIWTKEEAEATLKHQIEQFAGVIAKDLGQEHWNKLNDRQKAALVSLGYNVGPYFINKRDYGKRIKQAIINNDFEAASREIANGPKGGIRSGFLAGLARRRKEESDLFLA